MVSHLIDTLQDSQLKDQDIKNIEDRLRKRKVAEDRT